MCTSDSMDSCMAPGFWQTMISISEVRKRYYSEIESCKSKPIDQKFQLFCVATRHSRWSSEYREKHGLKFDKRTIYIVYFHTHVHVHIEKMGNLSRSKIKLYIYDNKLRSCAQFAPRLICSTEFAPPTKVEQISTRVQICTGVHFHKAPFIWPKYTPGANLHPGCIFAPGCILCIWTRL